MVFLNLHKSLTRQYTLLRLQHIGMTCVIKIMLSNTTANKMNPIEVRKKESLISFVSTNQVFRIKNTFQRK